MAHEHKIRLLHVKYSVPKECVLEAFWNVPVAHFQDIFQLYRSYQTTSAMGG
jgi:hypothetical protein